MSLTLSTSILDRLPLGDTQPIAGLDDRFITFSELLILLGIDPEKWELFLTGGGGGVPGVPGALLFASARDEDGRPLFRKSDAAKILASRRFESDPATQGRLDQRRREFEAAEPKNERVAFSVLVKARLLNPNA